MGNCQIGFELVHLRWGPETLQSIKWTDSTCQLQDGFRDR